MYSGGDLERAETLCTKALDLQPDHPYAVILYALLLTCRHNHQVLKWIPSTITALYRKHWS